MDTLKDNIESLVKFGCIQEITSHGKASSGKGKVEVVRAIVLYDVLYMHCLAMLVHLADELLNHKMKCYPWVLRTSRLG